MTKVVTEIALTKDLYSKEAILKTIYLFHDKFVIDIKSDNESYILTANSINNYLFDKQEFLLKLQEQQLREFLNNQSGNLREAIYKKAFSLVE